MADLREPVAAEHVERVSVVVLSYRRVGLLREALTALLAQTRVPDEILVVDNASDQSDEVARLVAETPGVTFVASPGNPGFAGGTNRGLACASGDWVWLSEDDLIAEPECLAALLAHARAQRGSGICGPLMLVRGERTIRAAGCRVSLGGVFRQENIAEYTADDGRFTEPMEVDFLAGAALFGRRDLFTALGGFREDFFIYYEDLDLCMRAQRRGARVMTVPAARVAHVEPQPSAPDTGLEFHKMKNLAAVYLLHAPWRVIPEFVLRYAVVGAVRALRRGTLAAHLRAWAWVVRHAARLIAERA